MGDFTCVKKTKSKAGKEFSAKLKLLHDGKVDFVFDKKKLAPRGANYSYSSSSLFAASNAGATAKLASSMENRV